MLFELWSLDVVRSELLNQLKGEGRSLTPVYGFVIFEILQLINNCDSLQELYDFPQVFFWLRKVHLVKTFVMRERRNILSACFL